MSADVEPAEMAAHYLWGGETISAEQVELRMAACYPLPPAVVVLGGTLIDKKNVPYPAFLARHKFWKRQDVGAMLQDRAVVMAAM